MTDGEKLIWAAVFAQRYGSLMYDPMTTYLKEQQKMSDKDFVVHITARAVEEAGTAINVLNNVRHEVLTHLGGGDSHLWDLFREMTH